MPRWPWRKRPAPAASSAAFGTGGSSPNYDLLKGKGLVRTDLYCTNCSRDFIVAIDMSLDGNHVVECPYCRHEHCRVVQGGVVTEQRYDSRLQRHDIKPDGRVWKSEGAPIATSTASAFIRDRWLNMGKDDDEEK